MCMFQILAAMWGMEKKSGRKGGFSDVSNEVG